MSKDDQTAEDTPESDSLNKLLLRLQLPFIRANYHELAQTAVEQGWGPLDYLQRLAEGEVSRREDKSLTQRIRRARFPLTKTLDQFQWNWPKKINRPQIQNLFRLNFIEQKSNAIFLGGVGLGKTHLCIALGHAACVRGYTVLFTTAIDIIHTLSAAAATGALKRAMQRYVKPRLLIVDELGVPPNRQTRRRPAVPDHLREV
jgi:DNA replication protein DnaC